MLKSTSAILRKRIHGRRACARRPELAKGVAAIARPSQAQGRATQSQLRYFGDWPAVSAVASAVRSASPQARFPWLPCPWRWALPTCSYPLCQPRRQACPGAGVPGPDSAGHWHSPLHRSGRRTGTGVNRRKDADQNPEGSDYDRDLGEQVAGLGAEGTLATHAAQGPRQAAAFAALQHDEDNHDDGRCRQKELQEKLEHDDSFIFWLYAPATMPMNWSTFRLAPPTNAPSISGWPSRSLALSGFTLPPYWMGTS